MSFRVRAATLALSAGGGVAEAEENRQHDVECVVNSPGTAVGGSMLRSMCSCELLGRLTHDIRNQINGYDPG